MSEHESFLARLEDVHEFPCDFVIKVIGDNDDAFVASVIQVSVNVLGRDSEPNVDTRESSGGKHISVTLTVAVTQAVEVVEIYTRLHKLEGVKFLL